MPTALERKYPKAADEWGWQYVFPSQCRLEGPKWSPETPSPFPLSGAEGREARGPDG